MKRNSKNSIQKYAVINEIGIFKMVIYYTSVTLSGLFLPTAFSSVASTLILSCVKSELK